MYQDALAVLRARAEWSGYAAAGLMTTMETPGANEVIQGMGALMTHHTPYTVSQDVGVLIREASREFPVDLILAEDLPFTPNGFVHFAEHFEHRLKSSDGVVAVREIDWHTLPEGIAILWFGLAYYGSGGHDPEPHLFNMHIYWRFGETLTQATERSIESVHDDAGIEWPTGEAHPMLRVAAALWSFLRQELFAIHPAPLNRNQRRTLARVYPGEPGPNVIVLRRRARAVGPTNPTGHHLTMRHVRSGHWHRYWHGPLAGPRTLETHWLIPMIVGPDGATLLAQGERLISVSR